MQSVSARIWTRVAVSISYDYNHYTTGTSIYTLLIDQIVLFLTIQSFQTLLYKLTIWLNTSHLFTHCEMIKQFYFYKFNLA